MEINNRDTLQIRFMQGFEGATVDRAADSFVLPLAEAERQINKMLKGASASATPCPPATSGRRLESGAGKDKWTVASDHSSWCRRCSWD